MTKKLIEIPTELFDKIVRLASENDRSVNKENTKNKQGGMRIHNA